MMMMLRHLTRLGVAGALLAGCVVDGSTQSSAPPQGPSGAGGGGRVVTGGNASVTAAGTTPMGGAGVAGQGGLTAGVTNGPISGSSNAAGSPSAVADPAVPFAWACDNNPANDESREWYVAANAASPSEDGSPQAPYQTISAAVRAAHAGDAVCVHGGTYAPEALTPVGASGSPIIIRAVVGERPLITNNSPAFEWPSAVVTFVHGSHAIFDGFEVTNPASRAMGINVWESQDITVSRCKVHQIKTRGLGGQGTDLVFTQNEVFDTALDNANGVLDANNGWPHAVGTWEQDSGQPSRNVSFTKNNVHDNWGECLDGLHVDGIQISDNVVHGCWSTHIYLDNARNARVERNFIYEDSDKYRRASINSRPNGISLAVENSGKQLIPAENHLIANNVINGVGIGLTFWADPANTASGNTYRNVQVVDNVLWKNQGASLAIFFGVQASSAPSNCSWVDNIASRGANGTDVSIQGPNPWSFTHNAWPDGIPKGVSDPAAQVADPRFVNPVPTAGAEGFKLQAGSSLARAGTPVPMVTTDFFGRARSGSAPTIGVDELP